MSAVTRPGAAIFKITATPAADGLADDTALWTTAGVVSEDRSAEIDKVLENLLVAASWESMAMRSVARSGPHLAPEPVAARRPAA